jgi:hypothetical protein
MSLTEVGKGTPDAFDPTRGYEIHLNLAATPGIEVWCGRVLRPGVPGRTRGLAVALLDAAPDRHPAAMEAALEVAEVELEHGGCLLVGEPLDIA